MIEEKFKNKDTKDLYSILVESPNEVGAKAVLGNMSRKYSREGGTTYHVDRSYLYQKGKVRDSLYNIRESFESGGKISLDMLLDFDQQLGELKKLPYLNTDPDWIQACKDHEKSLRDYNH
jgi:hypothetical protein